MLEFILYYFLLTIFIPTKQINWKINELEIPHFMQYQCTFSNMCFLDAQLSRQTGHILASGALCLCIQSMFTRITVGLKRASKWIIAQYSDILQTLVIIKNLKFLTNKMLLKNWQKSVWISRSLLSLVRFQSNCIDFSRRDRIHTRTHTLQTVTMSEINVV